ncbi:thioesterase-like superfamily-domain-containing protein [Podospora didyma]|uniref:Thioesterase-like superfamily-domain-containing protein n=1 Tax=Podospora didyma TaxID=330526 RepID=A0AAE0KJR1_9PEZI|nr:thioesterase-like superfamily-domain-containing protein [Podospora didyma]
MASITNPTRPSFADATKVERLDSHTYRANLHDAYCIGTVPNGGYVSSCLLQAASTHLAARGQKEALTAHFEFLTRTEVGPAVIVIEDIKPGRQLSTIHLTLYQHDLIPHAPWTTPGSSRREIVAYMTMTNLQNERGMSLPTAFSLVSPPPPPPNFAALLSGRDDDTNWQPLTFGSGRPVEYARCVQNCAFYAPRFPSQKKGILDIWVRLASGEGFTNGSLGFVADCWPYVVESYRPTEGTVPFAHNQIFWYPTIVLNLEQKKALPKEGVKWLQLRIEAKQIKNGRLDLEVVVLDKEGELVALSQHVNLILGAERNVAERKTKKSHI